MNRKALLALLALLIVARFLPAQDRRVALVIGNGNYATIPKLSNPANDATDVAAKLEGLGFAVTRLVDAKLSDMERGRQKFADDAKSASMRVFYYAGHGVQADGTNWLIPTDADVREDYELKLKAFSAQAILDGLKAAGPGINIVILDACRDNPFKASSRSAGAGRGLAVMGTSGSLIVYATAPGQTAADGKGRNGVFTQALLGRLDSPGVSLQEIMTNVSADVADLTKGAQEPWIQANLTKMVYLVTPEEAKARFAANLAKGQGDLDAFNSQLASLRQQVGKEQDAARKALLEVEIKKQAALAAQKELETEMLKAEAARQSQAEKDQAAMSAQLASFKTDAASREDAIRQAAEAKRKELAALQTGQGGILPFILAIETARNARTDLARQYDASLSTIKTSVAATYDKKLTALSSLTMDPWENDKEFKARVAAEQARLSGEKQASLADVAAQNDLKKQAALAPFADAETSAQAGLAAARTTYKGSAVKVAVGAFDTATEAKSFPVTLSSASPDLAWSTTFSYSVKSDTADELKRKYLEFDAWQKAGALFGEIDSSVRAVGSAGYVRSIDAVRLKAVDAAGERVLYQDSPQRPIVVFAGSADWNAPKPISSYLLAIAPGARITINGTDSGMDSAILINPKAGSYTIRGTFSSGVFVEERRSIPAGTTEMVVTLEQIYKLGDKGPAGGLVFYDKGSVSDGWRYLEAAPSDQSAGIQWWNGSNIGIKTGTAVGTGRTNTEAIIAAQKAGNYAASLCKNLSINGFSDWFLPSKDELNLMYTNLKKKGLGGLGEGWLWSSSQYDGGDSSFAWSQRFSDGYQGGYSETSKVAVRAVRAFGAIETVLLNVAPDNTGDAAAGTSRDQATGSIQKVYTLGDKGPAGGIVFYDKGSFSEGWRYLEAAPEDQSASIQWYNGSYINIKTGTAVGTGRANTEAIIAAQGAGNYALSLCGNLSINGFSDWFLPSKDELNLMYTNLKKKGLGGFGEGWFWSSSQYNGNGAGLQRFSDGNQDHDRKDSQYSVRAVRAF